MLFDLHRQMAQEVVIDPHQAVHFFQCLPGGVDVEKEIVALTVLFDPVGEGSKTPVFAFGNSATVLLEEIAVFVGKCLCGGCGNFLACDKHAFV